jgi:hypothetical protein
MNSSTFALSSVVSSRNVVSTAARIVASVPW